jgi:hypothetical protein
LEAEIVIMPDSVHDSKGKYGGNAGSNFETFCKNPARSG